MSHARFEATRLRCIGILQVAGNEKDGMRQASIHIVQPELCNEEALHNTEALVQHRSDDFQMSEFY